MRLSGDKAFSFIEKHLVNIKLLLLAFTSLLMLTSGAYYYHGNFGIFLGFVVVYTLVLWQLLFTRFSWFFLFFSVFMMLAYPFRLLMHLGFNTELAYAGFFDYSLNSYNELVLLATIGGVALLVAKCCVDVMMRRWIVPASKTYQFSNKLHLLLVWGVLFSVLLLAGFNEYFGVFHAGLASRTIFPYKLTALVYWCFILGVVFLLSYVVGSNVKSRRQVDLNILLILFATLTIACTTYKRSTLVLLALPMIMAVVYSNIHLLCMKRIVSYMLLWLIFLSVSIVGVANLRIDAFKNAGDDMVVEKTVVVDQKQKSSRYHGYQSRYWGVLGLILDRWPGIDGIAAVTSYPGRGWPLMYQGLSESYKKGVNGIYQKIALSDYRKMSDKDKSKYIFRTTCGFIGFFYYSGSWWFVFIAATVILMLFGFFEQVLYTLSMGNSVLMAAVGSQLAFEVLQLTIPKSLGVYLFELIVTLFMFHLFLKLMSRYGVTIRDNRD